MYHIGSWIYPSLIVTLWKTQILEKFCLDIFFPYGMCFTCVQVSIGS